MIDWSSSMQQTYEYYIVDPNTWGNTSRLKNVLTCDIDYDEDNETLGSASITCDDDIGECYIRAYLVSIQNGRNYRFPLGTFLVQTPSMEFDGKSKSNSLDAYTPLIELKEKYPPIGYAVRKGGNIMTTATRIVSENIRAPVSPGKSDETLFDHFVSELDDTWLSYLTDLISNAGFHFQLDEMGRVLFAPDQDTASLQPVWTYTDDNSSILYPEISLEHDLYGVPNIVEVIYSKDKNYYYGKAVNDDINSPISTVNRGREVVHRVTDPDIAGNPSQAQIEAYARQLLRDLSSLEYTLTYTHGYCPVRVGDCVRLDYRKAGLANIKARVKKQSIKCESGCPVTETAVFTTNLWR